MSHQRCSISGEAEEPMPIVNHSWFIAEPRPPDFIRPIPVLSGRPRASPSPPSTGRQPTPVRPHSAPTSLPDTPLTQAHGLGDGPVPAIATALLKAARTQCVLPRIAPQHLRVVGISWYVMGCHPPPPPPGPPTSEPCRAVSGVSRKGAQTTAVPLRPDTRWQRHT